MEEHECICTQERRIAIVETVVKRIDHDLFGNGGPGVIREIKRDLESVKKFQWQTTAIIAALIAVVNIVILIFGKR